MQNRRQFLLSGAGLAAASVMGSGMIASAQGAQMGNSSLPSQGEMTKRFLGKLQVSSIGLGVQNMSRTYQTTIPTRSEMHNIIRRAFDHGLTFYDAAEVYGPLEVERILGEG